MQQQSCKLNTHTKLEYIKDQKLSNSSFSNATTLLVYDWLYAVCVLKILHAQKLEPKMTPLSSSRFPQKNTHYPFINTGVDFLELFFIKSRKKTEKHYAIIFNCLTTRAAHLESCPDLKTDTFLIAFALFTARSGSPTTVYSENRKKFTEFLMSSKNASKNKNETKLAVEEIEWKFNPPYGPH